MGAQKVDDAAQSRPVDPEQLAARLRRVANRQDRQDRQDALHELLSGGARRYRTPTEDVDFDTEGKQSETIAYNALINDGCPPVYPIDRLEAVFSGLEENIEVLRPWDYSPDGRHNIFQRQLHRWKIFRRWQQHNREPDLEKEFVAYVEEQRRQDKEGTEYRPTASQYLEKLKDSFERTQRFYGLDGGTEEFAAYVKEKKQHKFEAGCRWPGMTEDEYMQMLRKEFEKKQAKEGIDDGDEGFAAFVKQEQQQDMVSGRRWPGMTEDSYLQMCRIRFNQEQNFYRNWEGFYWLREDHGRGGFSEYVTEAKRRLARHGFTKAFEFEKHVEQQDKLTTWIEYLNYEYSWLDKHTRSLTHFQPAYDKGRQKLLDSGVLLPGETIAGFFGMESVLRRQGERDAAKKAVEHAQTAGRAILKKAMGDLNTRPSEPQRIQMMKEATSRIQAAKASLRAVSRRCGLIKEFVQGASDYRATEEKIRLQGIRLQWARAQVPVIEEEVRRAKVAKDSSVARRTTKRRLNDDDDNDDTQERSVKPKKRSRRAGSTSEALSQSTPAKAAGAVNTMSTEGFQQTVTPRSTRRASGDKMSAKKDENSGSTVQQLQSTKQLRRSHRLAALRDGFSEVTFSPSRATRSCRRVRHGKTTGTSSPHT